MLLLLVETSPQEAPTRKAVPFKHRPDGQSGALDPANAGASANPRPDPVSEPFAAVAVIGANLRQRATFFSYVLVTSFPPPVTRLLCSRIPSRVPFQFGIRFTRVVAVGDSRRRRFLL